jgi:hypothetical protein
MRIGSITAGTITSSNSTGLIPAIPVGSSGPLTADQCKGQVVYSTGANTHALPAPVVGLSVTIDAVTAAIQTINPGTGKRIILDGVAKAPGATLVSDGTVGALVTLHADSTSGWTVVGKNKTWT